MISNMFKMVLVVIRISMITMEALQCQIKLRESTSKQQCTKLSIKDLYLQNKHLLLILRDQCIIKLMALDVILIFIVITVAFQLQWLQ